MRRPFVIALVVGLFAFTAQKLVKVKLNEQVTIYVPETFTPMSQADMKMRYESYRIPLALYTDPQRVVDFGVNRSYSRWQASDLAMMADFYQASLLELYDRVTFIDKGIKEINGNSFAYFEFNSVVYPENEFQDSARKYTYLMYGISEGTTYVFNFTCDTYVQKDWQETAHEMMEAVKLKP